ncbi:SERTA domain-containing protein 3 [Latimeria chalumnae]|uniref:SERTA domain containing 3 n=1 Tax=Latimeria chalumnae TaxID=7897 RepID=H3BE58_LATCH|nr:PREDICTED: SERTA domain-containing protein 3 [Latimeria chalumnae]|eukprot:XP_005991698.1 PREDICTED: SERTA domain-containing protein 3 [Latimeria chalumnae]
MMPKGLKRKFSDRGDVLDGCALPDGTTVYALQRQSVLNISLDKFQQGQMMVEPSLRRSVLIANTLRKIQEEIRVENSPALSNAPCAFVNLPNPPSVASLPENSPREATPPRLSMENHPSGSGDGLDDSLLLSTDDDFSLSSAISSLLKDLDLVIDGSSSQNPPRSPLTAIENLEVESRHDAVKDSKASCAENCKPLESVFGSFEIMSSSYLTDVTLDDLFLDIDTSVCDRDPNAVSAVLSSRTFPSANEEGKRLTCNSASISASQNIKDMNELDHIMEVLVRS